jgi:hypothetical protein
MIQPRRTMLDDLREHRLLAMFAAAMIAGWSAYGFAIDAKGAAAYLVMMVVLVAFVVFIHHRVGFSGPLLWALTAWGFLHVAGVSSRPAARHTFCTTRIGASRCSATTA